MISHSTPTKEVCYNIGLLYELSLQNNLMLTESVNNLRTTIEHLSVSESKLKEIIFKHRKIESKFKQIVSVWMVKINICLLTKQGGNLHKLDLFKWLQGRF